MNGKVIDIASIFTNDDTSIWDKQQAWFLSNRIIIFDNEVDVPLLRDVSAWILQWNLEDLPLAKRDRQPITIIIHSMGGDMYTAGNIMDVIAASETPVRTIALGLVASAAYYIYLSAPERYAFKNSIFLQHDGGVDLSNSNNKAKDTMKFFDSMNERVKQHVISNTEISEELYKENDDREWWMYADTAKELGIVHKIIGEDVSLKQIFK